MILTPAQRHALRLASRKGGVHVGTGKDAEGNAAPPKRVVKPVAAKLVAAGLAVQHNATLNITKEGRAALEVPVPDVPVYLRKGDGLTTLWFEAEQDESEYQDPDKLNPHWAEESSRRKASAEDRKAEARKLAKRLRAA